MVLNAYTDNKLYKRMNSHLVDWPQVVKHGLLAWLAYPGLVNWTSAKVHTSSIVYHSLEIKKEASIGLFYFLRDDAFSFSQCVISLLTLSYSKINSMIQDKQTLLLPFTNVLVFA